MTPWSSSPSRGLFSATRPRPVLSQAPPSNPIAAEPDGRRVLSRGGAADHAVTPKAPLTGSGCREHSYGGFGGGHPHFHPHAPDLRITRVFPCVAQGFKACASFMFAGYCWWQTLAVDGSSGASWGHAPVVRRPGSKVCAHRQDSSGGSILPTRRARGTRTPNLLIRRSGHVVQDRPSPVVGWADIPELSTCVGRRPAAWQQCWQQSRRNGADPRPSAFQAGHIPSWRESCERYALPPVAVACRWLLLLLSPLLSAQPRSQWFRQRGASRGHAP